jgi:hypothetical protein
MGDEKTAKNAPKTRKARKARIPKTHSFEGLLGPARLSELAARVTPGWLDPGPMRPRPAQKGRPREPLDPPPAPAPAPAPAPDDPPVQGECVFFGRALRAMEDMRDKKAAGLLDGPALVGTTGRAKPKERRRNRDA